MDMRAFMWLTTRDHTCVPLTGLSKNMREALKHLSLRSEVALLGMQIADRVNHHKAIPEGPIELNLDPADPLDWSSGVEELQTKTEDELYKLLGFEDKKVPFLASEIDEDTDIGVQAYEGENEDDTVPVAQIAKKPLRLKWHQLVGLVKLTQCALTSKTVLLMDTMGMGKTLQVLALFSVLAYYRRFYNKTKRYPGMWGESPICALFVHDTNAHSRFTGMDKFCGGLRRSPRTPLPIRSATASR